MTPTHIARTIASASLALALSALMTCSLLAIAVPALAQAPAELDAAAPLTLDVRAPDAVDEERLRAELERDLLMPVELATSEDDEASIIVELAPGGILRLRVARGAHPPLTRETEAIEDRERLTTTVRSIVSNLVRDESAELLAIPRAEPPVEALPAEESIDPPGHEAIDPPVLEPERAELAFGIDLLPGVGVSSATLGSEVRGLSLGVLGGLTGGVRGLAMSSVADIAVGSVDGAQLGGVLSVASSDVHGVQLGGVLAIGGSEVHGVQLGGVGSFAGGSVDGAQLASVIAVAPGALSGIQISLVSIAGADVTGAQLGSVNVAGASLAGMQLGLVNVSAGDVDGAQVGLVNIATGRVRGLQLGLVNVAEEADASIGLVTAQARGRTHVRVGADTNGFLNASLVHGGAITHMIASVGVEPFLTHASVALGLGLGARARLDDTVHFDFELVSHVLLDDAMGQDVPDFLSEARVLVGVRVADPLAVYVGLGYRVHVSVGDPELGAPVLEHQLAEDPLVRLWPALFAGVELF